MRKIRMILMLKMLVLVMVMLRMMVMATTITMMTTIRDFTRTNIEALRVQQLFGAPLGSQQDSEDLLEVQNSKISQVLTELEKMYGNKVDLLRRSPLLRV